MHVLMFGWEFPPIQSGGLGVACQGIVEGLVADNHHVYLVLPKTSAAMQTIDPSKFKAGDQVPRRFVAPWVGSAGDIQSKATYAAGKWTVVFQRKLDTARDDDIKFVAGQSYLFEIAVWDGIDHENHTVAQDVYTLTLK